MRVIIQMKEKCVQNVINLSIGLLTIVATGFGPVMGIVVKNVNDASVCRHCILAMRCKTVSEITVKSYLLALF
jgi:hypothetical protein